MSLIPLVSSWNQDFGCGVPGVGDSMLLSCIPVRQGMSTGWRSWVWEGCDRSRGVEVGYIRRGDWSILWARKIEGEKLGEDTRLPLRVLYWLCCPNGTVSDEYTGRPAQTGWVLASRRPEECNWWTGAVAFGYCKGAGDCRFGKPTFICSKALDKSFLIR